MRALVQRVRGAAVDIGPRRVAEFDGAGLLVLVAATHTDTPDDAVRLAAKIQGLRVFPAPTSAGPRELSVGELNLPVLVVSQFTLYGTTAKGRRPTWEAAAPGRVAEPLVDMFVEALRGLGVAVQCGEFGADMAVSSTNDGPLTLMIDVP